MATPLHAFRRPLLGLLAAAASPWASAGWHHICYEDVPDGKDLRMVVACADDQGQAMGCGVASQSPGVNRDHAYGAAGNPRVVASGDLHYFRSAGSGAGSGGSFVFTITPPGKALPRTCTVDAKGNQPYPGAGASDGVLTGFSTDASGHVVSGVWRRASRGNPAQVRAPYGFLVTGGGVEAAAAGFVRHSRDDAQVRPTGQIDPVTQLPVYQLDMRRRDAAADAEHNQLPLPGATPVAAYAIGLRIGNRSNALEQASKMQWPGTSSWPPSGSASVAVTAPASASVVLGAATWAQGPGGGTGHFLTADSSQRGLGWLGCHLSLVRQPCPVEVAEGWQAASKGVELASGGAALGSVSTRLYTLPAALDVPIDGKFWELRAKRVSALSPLGDSTTASARGLRGDHALTSIGGEVHWQPWNQPNATAASHRLTALTPRPDLGGADVAAASGAKQTLARLSASAIGVKLVEVGTPPDLVQQSPRQTLIDIDWLCRVVPKLDGNSAVCGFKGEQISIETLCTKFDELQHWGFCRPKP